MPVAVQAQVSDQLKELEKQGIISRIDKAEWVHALVAAKKKGTDEVRICGDMTSLNPWIIPDRHPLPNMKEMFCQLKGAKWFSKLDIRKAYWHIELDEESRPLTAFLTKDGLFQWNRLTMGLKDAASAFQKKISQVMAGLDGVFVYQDDILIAHKTKEEHDKTLLEVLRRLNGNDFRLNEKKLVIAVHRVNFLGHVVSDQGIEPDPKNLSDLLEAPTPKNITDIQSFLGMCNYYSEFLQDFSTISEQIRNLTRDGVEFIWTHECEKAFRLLKKMVTSDQCLAIFDPDCDLILATDDSDVGIGVVLPQIQDRKERPIAFASHTLLERERK
ncbi:MAG: hypothetical protein GY696_17135, partial [Gammaproteobacteria bacterium]|nr:hypothetical protein [Gammaproteobacteria bacterium]